MRAPSHLPLFWNVSLINGAVFVLRTLVLVLSPLSISSDVVVSEVVVVAVGLAVMLATNALLIRRSLAPLDRVIRSMEAMDHLQPGVLPEEGAGPVRGIARSFNGLLDRLAAAQRQGNVQALAAQESERHRIAQELHDEVGQSLTVVLLGLKQVESRAPADLVEELSLVRESARAGLDDVRRVARRLRPGVLEDLGLQSALAALVTDFSAHSGASVRRSFAPGLPALSAQAELVVYRVAQEALTNAARHAEARGVELSLGREGAAVVLEIRDDGRGFGVLAEGSGLLGMRERAGLVDAELTVTSQPRHGTTVRLRVPVQVIRILLADDHALVRRGVRLILEQEPDLAVVAEASDGAEAVRLLRETEVDLAVLDIAMPRMTGLQAAAEISRRRDPPRILMLSMHDNEQYFFGALKAGACGYVLKSVADEDLVGACRAAMRGETFLYPGAESALVRDYLDRLRRGERVPDSVLTPREDEVIKLIAEGRSSKEIAQALTISVKTVERHRANVLGKLGMRDRTELTRYAIRAGLIEP